MCRSQLTKRITFPLGGNLREDAPLMLVKEELEASWSKASQAGSTRFVCNGGRQYTHLVQQVKKKNALNIRGFRRYIGDCARVTRSQDAHNSTQCSGSM